MKKIVVITGANSGIGQKLKEKYLGDGNVVVGLDISGDFDNKTSFYADVSNEELTKEVFNKIGEMYGTINILINCAGYAVFGATELVETQKAKAMFDVNYFGVLNCIKSALPFMTAGSKIFNISSACALFAVPFRAHYCASKAAVSMLSYGLRMELKDSGIDVVCICPGDVKTNFSKNRVKTLETSERYGDRIAKSAKQIEDRESKRMTVDYATSKMYKIFNKRKHKPMYIIGGSMKFLNFVSKIVPLKTILYFTNKTL